MSPFLSLSHPSPLYKNYHRKDESASELHFLAERRRALDLVGVRGERCSACCCCSSSSPLLSGCCCRLRVLLLALEGVEGGVGTAALPLDALPLVWPLAAACGDALAQGFLARGSGDLAGGDRDRAEELLSE